MDLKTSGLTKTQYLLIAVITGILLHGSTVFFTLESTYDALIHVFFANHYANGWFETWNYSWYTGFTVTGYPPLVHQGIALFSFVGGLKFGLYTVVLIGLILFITGVYRFSYLLTQNPHAAGLASILAVFSSSFIETLHVFGQLPSIVGMALLLHSLPAIYSWLRSGRWRLLTSALLLLAVTVCSHHVTPIFGMVFFIFPLIGMALMDDALEKTGDIKKITLKVFLGQLWKRLSRIVIFGFSTLILIIGCILPYWINTKNNPINQVPIPHGSRDHFIEVESSGLVFFVIPWGILLLLFPYFFYRYFSKRLLFFGLSLAMLVLLGSGGTTPLPRMILGDNAFNILTLDRFTLWGSIMVLPLLGEFMSRLLMGDFRESLRNRWGVTTHRLILASLTGLMLAMSIFTISLGHFRPAQPAAIKMQPIVNFLNEDEHYRWRYLTLGFGDQMAWLSAQTEALTVDGNYHSARRLPELTTRAVERLENSKFRGVEGLGSLQQFLTVPEKYHLKYIFSNDKFYDPVLYFSGWQRLSRLENGIVVWERLGVPPLPKILPKEELPMYQRLMWGIVPLLTVVLAVLFNLFMAFTKKQEPTSKEEVLPTVPKLKLKPFRILGPGLVLWASALLVIAGIGLYGIYLNQKSHHSPQHAVRAYYDAMDFKNLEQAYELIDPNSGKSKEQFMLELSVKDGLLSSYAKMSSIQTTVTTLTDSFAQVKVDLEWIAPLQQYQKQRHHSLVKRNNKWYIEAEPTPLDLPPDQLYAQNTTQFYNHGRRRISSGATYHEDVLEQPSIAILESRLVASEKGYSLVGRIQNTDNVPADVALTGTLYGETGQLLASYNCKDLVQHWLMPKQQTNFQIDFENIAWLSGDSASQGFDPNEFNQVQWENTPAQFSIQIQSNVASAHQRIPMAIQQLQVNSNGAITGELFNAGVTNATVPQLLISYYNNDRKLLKVAAQYLEESVRPQRSVSFTVPPTEQIQTFMQEARPDLLRVNGLPNPLDRTIGIDSTTAENLLPIDHPNYDYISIAVQPFKGAFD